MKLVTKKKKTSLPNYLKDKRAVTGIMLRRIEPNLEFILKEPDDEDSRHTLNCSLIVISRAEYDILHRNLSRLKYINPSRNMGVYIDEAFQIVNNLETE